MGSVYPNGAAGVPIFGSGPGKRDILSKAIDMDSDLTRFSSLPPEPKADIGFTDDLFYLYTSGTTGLPKAAIFKHSRQVLTIENMNWADIQ